MENFMTIKEFCHYYAISKSTYYNLQNAGKGPKVMRISKRKILIPMQNVKEWEKNMEMGN